MKKILFYAMSDDRTYMAHLLLNALDLADAGNEVKIIIEGASVSLVPQLDEEKEELFMKAKAAGLFVGACAACSKSFGVYEKNEAAGMKMLHDMSGHAGMKSYFAEGYDVLVM